MERFPSSSRARRVYVTFALRNTLQCAVGDRVTGSAASGVGPNSWPACIFLTTPLFQMPYVSGTPSLSNPDYCAAVGTERIALVFNSPQGKYDTI
jgi:hypothetical protein